MVKQPIPLTSAPEQLAENIVMDMTLAPFANGENIEVYPSRLSRAASALGKQILCISSEVGAVSGRHYDATYGSNSWTPHMSYHSLRTVGIARTVSANESDDADGMDWIVLNTAEIADRIYEEEAGKQAALIYQGWPEFRIKTSTERWAKQMNLAVRAGLGQLIIKQDRSRLSTTVKFADMTMNVTRPFFRAHPDHTYAMQRKKASREGLV